MKLSETSVPGVWEAATDILGDDRGSFMRLFCDQDLAAAQLDRRIVQINFSVTRQVGAIRGLHYQHPPGAEAKWVRCLRGRIWDVAVDLRYGSPDFLRWQAIELSAESMNAVFIPEGVAHGFQVLEEDSDVLYLHTAAHAMESEAGIRWNDPKIGIEWPLEVTVVSERDRKHPLLDTGFEGVIV